MALVNRFRTELRLLFDAIDVDADRKLSRSEIKSFYSALAGGDMDDNAFEKSFQVLCSDDDFIYLDTFMEYADELFSMLTLSSIRQIYHVFQIYDRDDSKSISLTEVIDFFFLVENRAMDRTVLESWLKAVDENQDTMISWTEFLLAALKNFPEFEAYHKDKGIL